MKTIRWFRVTIPKEKIDLLGKSLLAMPFSEEVGEGFSIKKISNNIVIGKYIQIKPFMKEVITPLGDVNTITGVDYSSVDFKFDLNSSQILEIYSKPRTLRPFINIISSIIGIGFSIEKIKINLTDFIPVIESNLGKTKITKVVISDLNIDNKALGHLTLNSDQDIRKVIENQITLGRIYKIKYIKAYFLSGPYYGGYIELDNLSCLTIHNLPNSTFMTHYMETYTKYLSL